MADNAFVFGQLIGAALHGVSPRDYAVVKQAQDILEDRGDPGSRLVAALGAHIYRENGDIRSPEYLLFTKLATQNHWNPAWDAYVRPVEAALARHPGCMTKAANLENIAAISQLGPHAAKALMGGAAGLGAGAGALYWLLNQHVNRDELAVEALRAKTHTYKQLATEITGELRRRGLLADDGSVNPAMAEDVVRDKAQPLYVDGADQVKGPVAA